VDNDFRSARPGAGTGACIAGDYQVGRMFLLFLKKSDTEWVVSGPPFARVNEEVDGPNSPWVTAVQHYIRIGALENYEAEKLELRKLHDTAIHKAGDPLYPSGLAEDIDRYFQTPYPTRSYADLVALYNATPMERRAPVVWALSKAKHTEAGAFIRRLIESGEFINYLGPVSAYVERTRDATTIPALAAGYLRIDKRSRWPLILALIKAARPEHTPAMLAALKSADHEEAGRLAVWFVLHPDEEATAIIKKLVAGQYTDRWELTFSLAGLADEDTLRWALESIKKTDKNRWIGYYVIAASPLDAADNAARSIIASNDQEACGALAEEYGADGVLSINANPHRWERLRDIVDLPAKSKELQSRLTATLENMIRHGDDKAKELLSRLK